MQTLTNITTSTEKFKAAKSKSSWFNKTLAFSLLSFILGAAISVPATSVYINSQLKKASAAKIKATPKPVVKKPQKVDLAKPPVQNTQLGISSDVLTVSSSIVKTPVQNIQFGISSVAR